MPKKKPDPEGLEISWETPPEKLQKAYEEGSSWALDLCVLYCDHKRKRLPAWVRTELAKRVGEASDKMVKKVMPRKASASLAIAAIMVTEIHGFEGEDRFMVAEALLEGSAALSLYGKPFKLNNIKSIWQRRHKGDGFLVNTTAGRILFVRLLQAKYLLEKEKIAGNTDVEKIVTALGKLPPATSLD